MLTAAEARKSMRGQNRNRRIEYLEKEKELYAEYVSEAIERILKDIEKEAASGYSSFSFNIDYFEPDGFKKYHFYLHNWYKVSAVKDIIKELKRLGYKVKRFWLEAICTVYW